MRSVVLRELFVFGVLFILLALSMHYKAWIHHPLEHIKALPNSPFGLWHPLLFTFFFYILIAIVRVIIHLIHRFKSKRAG